MQTTAETEALLAELYERSSIVTELDGPQIEAWASGLFPVFDDQVTAAAFVDYCAEQKSEVGNTMCAAIGELTRAIDDATAEHARAATGDGADERVAQIGTSELTGAWSVEAPFGRSIVLGFENPNSPPQLDLSDPDLSDPDRSDDEEAEPVDLRHSILVEVGPQGGVEDLQLTGSARSLLDEAMASDDRVAVEEIAVAEAVALVIDAWPDSSISSSLLGPAFAANQQFVRRRLVAASGQLVPFVGVDEQVIDIRRGLDDDEFERANKAALSTLQAAVGIAPDAAVVDTDLGGLEMFWAGVIRGDAGDLPGRERDALLWLEWADWLGAGIGLFRAGAGADVTGSALVDCVNRCPEVSSSIEKADRDYAVWAFEIAIDLLTDRGAIEDDRLTQRGFEALGPAMLIAWG